MVGTIGESLRGFWDHVQGHHLSAWISVQVVLVLFIPGIPAAAEEQPRRNLFSTDLWELPFGRIEVNYERAFRDKHSIGINPKLGGLKLADEWQFRCDLTYNYCSKGSFRGLWLTPRLSLYYAAYEPGGGYSRQILVTLEPALGAGYRWLLWNRLFLGIGLGAGPTIELRRDELMESGRFYFFTVSDIGIVFGR